MPVTLTIAPPATGLVGAWGFDERVGRQVLDSSGAGNPGRLSGATRTRGRFGGGLWFDGRNDWVTVAGDRSLDLSGGMTLSAWVRPSARGGRSVLVKDRRTGLSYGLLARPSGHVFTTAEHALRGRALKRKRWSHLAMTWDGLIMRVYVNGAQVARHPHRHGEDRGRSAPDRRQRDLAGVLQGHDRRGAGLRPRPHGGRDRPARDSAITPGAPQPRAHETTSRGKPRKTRRAAHRGTRWLSGAGAAARPG